MVKNTIGWACQEEVNVVGGATDRLKRIVKWTGSWQRITLTAHYVKGLQRIVHLRVMVREKAIPMETQTEIGPTRLGKVHTKLSVLTHLGQQ